jgi:hypothetical protein
MPPGLAAREFVFRDAGRRLYAYVAVGKRGPIDEAEAVLNSLRVEPPEGPTFISAERIPESKAKFNLLSEDAVFLRTSRVEIEPGEAHYEIGTCPDPLKVRTLLPVRRVDGNPTTSPRFDYRYDRRTVTYAVTNHSDAPIRRRFFVACAPKSSFDDS